MKKRGVRRPKQRPPNDSTIIPDKGLLFVTSMARAVYCTHTFIIKLHDRFVDTGKTQRLSVFLSAQGALAGRSMHQQSLDCCGLYQAP